jgi:elongation factor G
MSALVFKIVTDPYVGRLGLYPGLLGQGQEGQHYQNATQDQKERVGRLLRMYADHREDVDEIHAGDIGAILGFEGQLYRRYPV